MPNARPIIRSPVKQPARKAAILVQKVPADQNVGNKPDRPVAPLATAQPISPLITAEHQKLTVGLSLPAALPAVWSAANVRLKPVRTAHLPPDAPPEPIPKSPAKRNMAPPVTVSAIAAPTLVTNQTPLASKALARPAGPPVRQRPQNTA